MYRQDYVLRLIERLGAALIALRNRILRRERDEIGIRTEIAEIAGQAGLDLAVARRLDPEMLLMWLAPAGQPEPGKLWLLAELLYLEGLHTRESGADGWQADLERALALLVKLPAGWRPGEAFVPSGERAEEIRGLLKPSD